MTINSTFLRSLGDKQIFLILCAIGFLVYYNSLFNDFVIDDNTLISANPFVQSLTNIKKLLTSGIFPDDGSGITNNYYRPVEPITYALIYSAFGQNTLPFHFVQVLFHIANSFLVFLILEKFIKRNIAFFASLIFLVHPINTEAVSYIAILQDTQSMFFGLFAFFISFREKTILKNLAIFSFLLLSIFSKESGVLFVFLILARKLLFQKKVFRSDLFFVSLPIFIYAYIRFFIARIYFNGVEVIPIMQLSFFQRILNVPEILFFYLKTFAFPKDLVILQSWTVKSLNFGDFYLPLILDTAFFLILIKIGYFVRSKNIKLLKSYIFFCVWFIVGLFPYLQIIPVDQTVSDRWFYFPIVGLLGIFATFASSIDLKNKFKPVVLVAFILIIILLSVRVVLRNANFSDNETLCTHDVKIQSENWQLEDCMAVLSISARDYGAAEYYYKKAAELFPSPMTLNNLGFILLISHKPEEAKNIFIQVLSSKPSAKAYHDLAILSLANEGVDEAEKIVDDGLKKFPSYQALLVDKAMIKYKQGDSTGAIQIARKAYNIFPSQNILNIINAIESGQTFDIQKF